MRLHRMRNKILQQFYRPMTARRGVISPRAMDALEEINDMIEQKITPLLSGLWK